MTPAVDLGEWLQTVSGRQFYPRAPGLAALDIGDIAHALGMLCRFGGHSRAFYSVAEHSVRVSELVEELGGTSVEIFWGLMHDASEAYLGDVTWPVKRAPEMEGYKDLEELAMVAICTWLELPLVQPAIVKHADLVMLATEKRDLMGPIHTKTIEREAAAAKDETERWHCDDVKPHPKTVQCWGPYDAKALFLSRFEKVKPR